MGLLLIDETEKLIWRHETTSSGFYYRRPTQRKIREVQVRHTVKGVINDLAVVEELLEWAILGWFGIFDKDSNEVTYSPILLARIPDNYKADFVLALYDLNPEIAELKN